MPDKRIAVIGLGDMGLPMTRRMLQHGLTVVSCAKSSAGVYRGS